MFAKKSLGQNFLMHAQTAQRIVEAAGITPNDTVLEVGPGTGMLTRALLARAGRVVAVEADHTLVETLKETFAIEIEEGRLTLIHEDIRNFDIAPYLKKPQNRPNARRGKSIEGDVLTYDERDARDPQQSRRDDSGASYSLVANIPYYITGEIIRQFLTSERQPRSMTLLVQKEVAERIARSKKESLLSLSVKAYGTPKYVFTVPRGAFRPAPNVDSAVLHIKDITRDLFGDIGHEERFFKVLHAGFAHKRKQLGNNLEALREKDDVRHALAEVGIESTVRAEDLKLSTWLALARSL